MLNFYIRFILGTMEDGLHLIYSFWELLVWSSLGIYELVDSLEFISITNINQVSLLILFELEL